MSEKNTNIYIGQIASPPTKFEVGEMGGRVRAIVGQVTLVTGDFDADGDTIRLCQLPSNARLLSLRIANEDIDSGTDSNVAIGLYADQGAVIDEDEFATGSTIFQAQTLVPAEAFGIGIATTALGIQKPMWERAGLTSDTKLMYDIVITEQVGFTEQASAVMEFILLYTID